MSRGRVSAERHPSRPGPGTEGPERSNHLPKRRNLLAKRKRVNRINEKPRDERGIVIVNLGPFSVTKDPVSGPSDHTASADGVPAGDGLDFHTHLEATPDAEREHPTDDAGPAGAGAELVPEGEAGAESDAGEAEDADPAVD